MINLEKWELITWNLGQIFEIELWWLVNNTVDECLQRQIAKKIFKSKIEARPVNAGHYMAFKHRISFATDLAANFDCICSESRLTSFPSFCAPPSEVAGLFDSNLSRHPFLGQVVDLDLLLCTGFDSEHAVLFRSDFGRHQLLANSIEIFISHEKEKRRGPKFTKH